MHAGDSCWIAVAVAGAVVGCRGAMASPDAPPQAGARGTTGDDAGARDAPPTPRSRRVVSEAQIRNELTKWGALLPKPLRYDDYLAVDDEQQWYFRTCFQFADAFTDALDKAAQAGGTPRIADVVVQFSARFQSESLSPTDIRNCGTFTIRSMRAYLYSTVANEARVILRQLGDAMTRHHSADGALCPSSDAPAPSQFDPETHTFRAAGGEFARPAWTCLGFQPGQKNQRFQYSVSATPNGFAITARGSVRGDDTVQTYEVRGKLADGKLESGPITGPSNYDLAKALTPLEPSPEHAQP